MDELITRPIRTVKVAYCNAEVDANEEECAKWIQSMPVESENKFREFMCQYFNSMLAGNASCEKDMQIKQFVRKEGKGLNYRCCCSVVDLGFSVSGSVLPFLIEVKNNHQAQLQQSFTCMDQFTHKIIQHFQQTLVYSLSGQAFVHRMKNGHTSPMECLLVYPNLLFLIRLTPSTYLFKWDVDATYVLNDSPHKYKYHLERYCSNILNYVASSCTEPQQPWIPFPFFLSPLEYFPNHGFLAKFDCELELVVKFFSEARLSARSLQDTLDFLRKEGSSNILLKHLSSLISYQVNEALSNLSALIVEWKIWALTTNAPPLSVPYLGVSTYFRLIVMKFTGTPLQESMYLNWSSDTKQLFFNQVCYTAIITIVKMATCHNDIRCANITYDSFNNQFCLVDWDQCSTCNFVPSMYDGRYPKPYVSVEINEPVVFTTVQLLNVICCLDESSMADVTDPEKFREKMGVIEANIKHKGPKYLVHWAKEHYEKVHRFLKKYFPELQSSDEQNCDEKESKEDPHVHIVQECLSVLCAALSLEEDSARNWLHLLIE